jgi:(R,R)-butanediol dehydrogenase / meso-butanediol dehydrogenase / diacetyl reductase
MKAAVYHGRHDIRVESVPEPDTAPADGLVLAVVRAAICGTDSSEWDHGPKLTRPPVILGHEFVGRVVDVGADVEGFSIGDRVVSGAGVSCGRCEWCRAGRTNLCAHYYTLGLHVDGGLAERVTTPASICRKVPQACTDTAAAMAQPLAVALHAVRRCGVRPGETCAVIGAGGIGAFIVAAAAARGISPLIAVDIDDARLETARRLGADIALSSAGRGLAEVILGATDGEGAHVVIEASGVPIAPAAALAATRRGGRALIVGLQAAPSELDLFAITTREVEIATTLAHVCGEDIPEALDILSDDESLAQTVLDRVIPLAELVEEGIRPLAEHRADGKIVVDPHGP